jgi:hypothetical protein
MWQLRYGANSTTLAVTIAGDYNDNGMLDAADYVLWRKLNGSSFNPRADGDTNGVIDSNDYAIWRSQIGASAGAGTGTSLSSATIPVPEPATIVLIGWLLAAVTALRGRDPYLGSRNIV